MKEDVGLWVFIVVAILIILFLINGCTFITVQAGSDNAIDREVGNIDLRKGKK
jgi:hypothetical protein